MDQKEREEEIFMIVSFPGWPHYPICPVVNRDEMAEDEIPEVGFILAADVMIKKAIVYHENFLNLGKLREKGIDILQIKKTEYKNFDEMIDNGWKVD